MIRRPLFIAVASCAVSTLILVGLWAWRPVSSVTSLPQTGGGGSLSGQPAATRLQPTLTDTSAVEPAASQPVTRLPYRLVGTLLGDRPAAILESRETKRRGEYQVGDRLAGWTLIAIRLGSVTFRHDSGRQLVVFATPDPAHAQADSPPVITLPLGRAAEEAPQLQARLRADGTMDGVLLKRVEQFLPARLADLRDGDLLTALNGQRLTSPQKTIQVLRKVRATRRLTLDLERSGRTLSKQIVP